MTTRKKLNLGDVIREKVQNSPAIASDNVITIESMPVNNQDENALALAQAEINKLQSILGEQKNLVSRLQDELELTKKAALDLADSNSDLIQENQHLKQENTDFKSKDKQKSLPVLARPQRDVIYSTPSEKDFAANIYLY